MLFCFQRGDTDRFMHMRWQADVNHVNLRIGEEIINLIILAYVRKFFETAAGSKVA